MAKRTETSKRNWGKIHNEGMGGFLNPPTHPEHKYSVKSVYGYTFSMSLSSAVECEWLNDETKAAAKRILKSWQKPDLESEIIQDWIHHVLGYFKNCYSRGNYSEEKGFYYGRNVNTDLMICDYANPILEQNRHLGVMHIREFYPEYTPCENDFENAYWGKKEIAI